MNYTQQCQRPGCDGAVVLCSKCEWIEERAAILEFDGDMSREDAERYAAELYVDYEKSLGPAPRLR